MKNELKRASIQLALCPGICDPTNLDEACKICAYKHEPECTTLLKRRVATLLEPAEEQPKAAVVDLETRVSQILHELGIPASLIGYRYVRHAIVLVVEQPDLLHAMVKRLYPRIAEKYNTTASRAERAIRHAVEVAWDRGDVDILLKWFGYTVSNMKGKPTNSEFIGMIADAILLERKEN